MKPEGEEHEYFGITIMREAIAQFEDGVTQGLMDMDAPVQQGEALARVNEINRIVKLAAKWFELHISDSSGSYDMTLRFLKCVYSDLLAEGLEEFLKYGDKSWGNPETSPLWSAGVTYVYLRMVQIIRKDSSALRKAADEAADEALYVHEAA